MSRHALIFDQLLLVAFCALLFFPFLGSAVLWDYDEGYFASIAKEMYEKGDWIVPTFNDSELGDKPILIFWGMLVSFSVFGVSEFAVRFPSVVYGIGTVLLTYHIARRLFHDHSLAVRAGIILATMLLFVVETRGTTCDGAMICWMTASLAVYVYGSRGFREEARSTIDSTEDRLKSWFPERWLAVVLIYACLGMATLAKGPAAFVLGTAVIGLFLLVKSYPGRMSWNPLRWAAAFLKVCWKMRPLTALVVILIVAGPWFLAVGYKTDWQWAHMFFIEHNLERSVSVTREHTGFGLSLLYYPITSLFGTFPWSLFLLPWAIDLFRCLRRDVEPKNAFVFAVCWVVLFFGFFSLISTKLPHYVAPAYPALAILLGSYLTRWRREEDLSQRFWTPVVPGVMILVGLGIVVIFYIVLPRYIPREQWAGMVLGLLPATAGFVGIYLYRKRGRKALEIVYIVHAFLFTAFLFQWASVEISEHAVHRTGFFRSIRATTKIGGQPVPSLLLSASGWDPSWIFYSEQPIRKIPEEFLIRWKPNEVEPAILIELLRETMLEQEKQRPKYFSHLSESRFREGRIYFILESKEYEKTLKPLFGKNLKILDRTRRFLRAHELLLLVWDEDETG